ncbi:MAG: TatD family hydrolase [Simkaniaceae bacterium]|nr:TatD family hydrolase [Simkaniaceae bacterium]
MFFDSHAHLTGDPLFASLPEILKRGRLAGVTGVMNICTDLLTLERALEVQEKGFFVAGATTPQDAALEGIPHFPRFEKAAREGELHAVGETGLDYGEDEATWPLQRSLLEKYTLLAEETSLPLIFHCRGAFDDLYEVTKGYAGKAVMHCFTGSIKEAEEALSRGWMISLSGILTFKKAMALREVAQQVPKKQLLIETDAPYLAPESRRGKVNEPSFIIETCATLAALHQLSLEEMGEITYQNALQIFSKK